MLRVYDVLGIEYLLFKLEKKMLRIAIFRNVSRDFFFFFCMIISTMPRKMEKVYN